ncbi:MULTISPECIES: histidine--tRNA ligase [Paenarthrobacter]|jgi:histidyl-tRNA synthetase|uniref:histidine--tRNA ligase n=1 Tax=Paenarthrobacter TaxID=1742992 RepID=UPI0003625BD6|nr:MULTISPECIES: histidine--tRNA ligase [Paenarthrobacter]SKB60836.1 histidyl-tRNA synthetase [Arthrobacter sp. 31Cvi3.1E]BCW40780.1 histidine--tRNA ligase [Arthrobacter sp. StoSoilB3]MBP2396423.1 histidyl-tRNA synthetase [Paenarthrobacter nicotinovorans]MDI2022301.1 Histidine--tRNA ligase [Paenarthrobacter nicotinovorans]UKE97513.1 histidine--tRNA ligase [Paenarthrobacter nicotinovorans]
MARTASLSGFPEWLPQERLVELHVLDTLRKTFELHGFSSIETRAVETVGQLLRKGEIDKEVYGLSRLQDDEGEAAKQGSSDKSDPNALALHFDLTVPFARYVVENAGYLAFPFRRYQIQKVWRGERPQEGRAREFTQADIDVVGDGELPFRYDVEIALVIAEALSALPIPDFRLRINNRKLAEGFYRGIGLTDTAGVLRSIDKLEKIGADKVAGLLKSELGATDEQAALALQLATIRTEDTSFVEQVRALGVKDDLLEEGLSELQQVIEAAVQRAPGKVVADLSIARGLDYYTGTVVETVLVGHEQLGSICSGGRYDALASKGNRKFPGVGLSIGVTRLVSRILSQELATASRAVPTAVLVALNSDDSWSAAQDIAAQLRGRGIATEVAAKAEKFGKQIKFADRRGIPFVWFTDDDGKHQVKDIRSGEQVDADPTTWTPPEEDLHVRVTTA